MASPRSVVRVVLLLAALAGAGPGCSQVRPWQREDLARIDRCLGRAAATRSYEAHMWMVREGLIGGNGKPGGGCGCN